MHVWAAVKKKISQADSDPRPPDYKTGVIPLDHRDCPMAKAGSIRTIAAGTACVLRTSRSHGKKHVPISKYIRANIIMHLFRVDIRQVLLSHSWNVGFVSSFVNKIHGKLWGDDIINSLILHIHIHCSRNVSMKITDSKFHIFLIYYPIYINFSLFCSKIVPVSIDLT